MGVLRVGSVEMKTSDGVCLQEFDQMVGLERFEMVVELVEEVFVLCWHLWVVLLDDMH